MSTSESKQNNVFCQECTRKRLGVRWAGVRPGSGVIVITMVHCGVYKYYALAGLVLVRQVSGSANLFDL